MNETPPSRKLTRSRSDRYVGGVAAGIADRLNIDPIFVRIAFLISLVFGGLGLISYLVLLVVMPVDGDPNQPMPPIPPKRRNRMIGLAVIVGFICLLTVDSGSAVAWLFGFWPGTLFGIFFWVAAAGVAFWLLINGFLGNRDGSKGPSAPTAVATTPAPESPEAETQTFADAPTQVSPTRVMETEETANEGEQIRSKAPSIIGRVALWCAVGLAALTVFSVLFVVSAGTTAVFGAIPMAALVVVLGSGMVFAALRGRRQLSIWLLTAAIAVTIPMAFVTIADLRIEGSYGDIDERPLSVRDIPSDGYQMAAGSSTIDLRHMELAHDQKVFVPIDGGMGLTSVIVPDDVCVLGGVTGKVGAITMRGRQRNGINVDLAAQTSPRFKFLPFGGPTTIEIRGDFKVGAFEVVDNTEWQQVGRGGTFDNEGSAMSMRAQKRALNACSFDSDRKGRTNGKLGLG